MLCILSYENALFFQWLLKLVLFVLVVNAAGMNVFGVLAVDFSTVVVVNNEDPPSSQQLSSVAPSMNNSTVTFSLPISSVTSSPSPVTTAKTLTSLEKQRSDFCLLFPQYEALCKGWYILIIILLYYFLFR